MKDLAGTLYSVLDYFYINISSSSSVVHKSLVRWLHGSLLKVLPYHHHPSHAKELDKTLLKSKSARFWGNRDFFFNSASPRDDDDSFHGKYVRCRMLCVSRVNFK